MKKIKKHISIILIVFYTLLLTQVVGLQHHFKTYNDSLYSIHIEKDDCNCFHDHNEKHSTQENHNHQHCVFCCEHLDFLKHKSETKQLVLKLQLFTLFELIDSNNLIDCSEHEKLLQYNNNRAYSPLERFTNSKGLRAPPFSLV